MKNKDEVFDSIRITLKSSQYQLSKKVIYHIAYVVKSIVVILETLIEKHYQLM